MTTRFAVALNILDETYGIVDCETGELVDRGFEDRRHAAFEAAVLNGADPAELLGE